MSGAVPAPNEGSGNCRQGQGFAGSCQEQYRKAFPGAEITEVELTTKDGIHYEVYIAEDGKILKIEEEDDWFGFGE